ncbi:MAG: hypothetical protein IKE76_11735, partial [Clostridia bacterium]|nr:hypothetical protein [Clostridia bacterium]
PKSTSARAQMIPRMPVVRRAVRVIGSKRSFFADNPILFYSLSPRYVKHKRRRMLDLLTGMAYYKIR